MALSVALPASAICAELLMLEQDACEWCERWHEEIGSIYPKTSESQIAPLRIVNIHDPWPEDLDGIRNEYFTPTFVLVHEGKEISRLRGYPGEEFFWPMIEQMIEKLPGKKIVDG